MLEETSFTLEQGRPAEARGPHSYKLTGQLALAVSTSAAVVTGAGSLCLRVVGSREDTQRAAGAGTAVLLDAVVAASAC